MDKEKLMKVLEACLLAYEGVDEDKLKADLGKEEAIAGIKLAKYLHNNY